LFDDQLWGDVIKYSLQPPFGWKARKVSGVLTLIKLIASYSLEVYPFVDDDSAN